MTARCGRLVFSLWWRSTRRPRTIGFELRNCRIDDAKFDSADALRALRAFSRRRRCWHHDAVYDVEKRMHWKHWMALWFGVDRTFAVISGAAVLSERRRAQRHKASDDGVEPTNSNCIWQCFCFWILKDFEKVLLFRIFSSIVNIGFCALTYYQNHFCFGLWRIIQTVSCLAVTERLMISGELNHGQSDRQSLIVRRGRTEMTRSERNHLDGSSAMILDE